jgi:hypothetical protein
MALRFHEKKKPDNSKKWLALFVGFIMLASVLGFVFSYAPNSSNFRYGKQSFTQLQNGGFVTDINGRQVYFSYTPEQASSVNMSDNVKNLLAGSRSIWVSYDWNSSLVQQMDALRFDLSTLLVARNDAFVQLAYLDENPSNYTVKNCSDATSFVPVLVIRESNESAINSDELHPGCIVADVTPAYFEVVADRLKYAVMEN